MTTAPRIHYLYPALLDSDAVLTAQAAASRAMGFTHLMMAAGTESDTRIEAIAAACNGAGLQLLLDLTFDAGSDARSADEEQDPPPDPRRQNAPPALHASTGNDRDNGDGLAEVQARLGAWLAAGVAGFCCRGLATRPPAFWRSLIAQAKSERSEACFIAWTPGCTARHLGVLGDCGFDATVASTAWWDYRAPWLAQESLRLAPLAPPIALVDDPLAPLMSGLRGDEDDAGFRRRCQRALGLAAASGCGMLVPMGYEFGFSGMKESGVSARLDLAAARSAQRCDLTPDITAANALVATLESRQALGNGTFSSIGTPHAGVTLLLRQAAPGKEALLIAINPDPRRPVQYALEATSQRLAGMLPQECLWPVAGSGAATGNNNTGDSADADAGADASSNDEAQDATDPVIAASNAVPAVLQLDGGALQVLAARALAPVVHFVNRGKRSADAACRAPRVAIEAITPSVDGGRFPVKRNVGDRVDVEADVFMDGHDKLGVMLLWRPADVAAWQEVRMSPLGNDRWRAVLPLNRTGRHLFTIQAWRDAFATYRDELSKKSAAGLDVTLELEEGRRMIAAAATHAAAIGYPMAASTLSALAARMAPPVPAPAARKGRAKAAAATSGPEAADMKTSDETDAAVRARLIAEVLSDEVAAAMQQADDRPFAVLAEPVLAIQSERLAARFSSWYELFPRSQSGSTERHGTFADVEKRLPAIRDMGFDTLYFPPIHPIGKRNRKGRNNSLTPTENDPGSPYAIGAADGGHDAIHAELGTLADFRHLVAAAQANGLEIALDFAIQCSPDHPWIEQHPDWFAWRPDGSMRYAENPPKKYEDIVNVDFYAAGAMPALWIALRNAVLFWVTEGVRVFRVDNPHTKPLPFWEWMIGDITSRYPDTIFLSEAFTRPKVMYRLAKVGFSQSYSYFTWRHTSEEFTDYMTELSTTAVKDFFRPNFFVNTPDINPVFLQKSGRPGFLIRAALATLLSGLWGMYSGFELCEATPVPGKEDYLDSEKYEIRAWDWNRPGNIIEEITVLNRIRRAHPALQSHLGTRFCESSDPNLLCFLRHVRQPGDATGLGDDVLFVAINLDPFAAHETHVELPLWQLGVPDDGMLDVEDLVHGNRFTLQGRHQQLRLDPGGLPYVVWQLAPGGSRS